MPVLVAQRLAQRLAEHDGHVLDGVVRRRCRGRRRPARSGRSAPCLPSASSMWSKNGTPVEISVWPVPSRSISTSTLVSLVTRSTRPIRFTPAPRPSRTFSRSSDSASRATQKASFSSGVPTVTRSRPGMPTSRIRTPRSRKACHAAGRVGEPPEQHEVRVAGHHVVAGRGQPGDHPVALGPQQGHRAEGRRRRAAAPPWRRPGSAPTGGRAAGPAAARPRRPARRPGSRAGHRRTRTPCSSCARRSACAGYRSSRVIALGWSENSA